MADMPVNLDDVDRLERRGDIKGAINLCRDGLVGADDPAVSALLHLRIGRCLLETELAVGTAIGWLTATRHGSSRGAVSAR